MTGDFRCGWLASEAMAVGLTVGTGRCGALSTYSTFSYATVRLLETRAGVLAVADLLSRTSGQ